MIKFFRKIRQRLLSENRFSKYFLYAIGEIALVMIGILLALQINNWNSQRLKSERDQKLLEKLSQELDLNIERAALLDNIASSSFSERVIFTDSLMKLMNNDMLASQLDYLVREPVFYVNTFNLNSTVFEELKNTGSLYSIGSDSLVTQIQRYYQRCERESFYNLNYSEKVRSLQDKCYDGFIDFKYLYKRDPDKALKHHAWINDPRSPQYIHMRQYVQEARIHSWLMSDKLKWVIKGSKELKELISTEVKGLKQD